MTGYCASCGSPINKGFKFCTMCSGNPDQGSDDYARQYFEQAERERQQQEQPSGDDQ